MPQSQHAATGTYLPGGKNVAVPGGLRCRSRRRHLSGRLLMRNSAMGDSGTAVTGRKHQTIAGRIQPASRAMVSILAIGLLSSCTHSQPPGAVSGSTRPESARSSPAGTSTSAVDRAAVDSAYRAFWPVLTSFDRKYREAEWKTVVARVAVDPQLSQAIAVARQQRRTGVRLYGQPRPRVPTVSLASGNRATVADCADFSHYGQADAKTGKPRTVGVARTAVRVTLAKGTDGLWRVADVAYPGGTC